MCRGNQILCGGVIRAIKVIRVVRCRGDFRGQGGQMIMCWAEQGRTPFTSNSCVTLHQLHQVSAAPFSYAYESYCVWPANVVDGGGNAAPGGRGLGGRE